MANKNYVKLVMVTSENNNKYYEMTYTGGSTFTVKYGRVESTAVTKTYPYSKWSSIYNEKVGKGYRDMTDMVAVKVTKDKTEPQTLAKIGIPKVDTFITKMKGYTDDLVSSTYSVKCTSVSQAQVDEAQSLINNLSAFSKEKKPDTKKVNDTLISLYTTIPRYMGKVQDHIMPSIKLDNILQSEQDKLDAMASQVSIYNETKGSRKVDTSKTILDVMGITMQEAKDTSHMDYLMKQLKGFKIEAILEVSKPKEDKDFEEWRKTRKDQSTKILIHGTKCISVIPILEIGLKIRPTGNFQSSGKAYGYGNYFSEVVQKSMGYTDYGKDRILFVYEVHTGNPYVYGGWYKGNDFPLTLAELTKRGFDSTYVKAGGGLLNSEIIAYSEKQNRIKNIIWIRN